MSSQRYSPEFKDGAVRQVVERGYSAREVAERLGVSSHSLYKWVRDVRPDKREQHAQELAEAKSEILKLRASCGARRKRDILKSRRVPFQKARVNCAFINEHRRRVATMCRVLGVHRSGFYA